mmetsp:Transcript_1388/g.4161  ORF Transcript_1388/g.4161 Transcript_1388/m.4161 type:complete len:244 (-) Transcript_1388:406-1137(-)
MPSAEDSIALSAATRLRSLSERGQEGRHRAGAEQRRALVPGGGVHGPRGEAHGGAVLAQRHEPRGRAARRIEQWEGHGRQPRPHRCDGEERGDGQMPRALALPVVPGQERPQLEREACVQRLVLQRAQRMRRGPRRERPGQARPCEALEALQRRVDPLRGLGSRPRLVPRRAPCGAGQRPAHLRERGAPDPWALEHGVQRDQRPRSKAAPAARPRSPRGARAAAMAARRQRVRKPQQLDRAEE